MKNHPLLALLLIMLFFCSCTTLTTFDSPNNTGNIKGTLYLNDGRSLSGFLTINTNNKKNDKVLLQSTAKGLHQKFKLKNIKGYTTGNDQYFVKEVANNTLVIQKGYSLLEQLLVKKKYYFMKQLTPSGSRIHLFENNYMVSLKEISGSAAQRVIEYYIQLPQDSTNKVYSIDGEKLLPNFDSKMSRIVSGCPELARKIAQKEPGYFYAPLSLPILSQKLASVNLSADKNVSVLLRIIEEYNHCK